MPIQGSTGVLLRRAKRDISKGYPEEEGEVWDIDYERSIITVRMLRNLRMQNIKRCLTSSPRSANYGEAEMPKRGDLVVVGYLNGEVSRPYIKGYLRTPKYADQSDDLKPAKGEFRRKMQSGVIIEADADGNIEITLPRTRGEGEDEEEIQTTLTINGREVKVVDGQTIFNAGAQGVVSEAQFKRLMDWIGRATQMHPYGPTTGWVEQPPEIKTTHDILVNEDWKPE